MGNKGSIHFIVSYIKQGFVDSLTPIYLIFHSIACHSPIKYQFFVGVGVIHCYNASSFSKTMHNENRSYNVALSRKIARLFCPVPCRERTLQNAPWWIACAGRQGQWLVYPLGGVARRPHLTRPRKGLTPLMFVYNFARRRRKAWKVRTPCYKGKLFFKSYLSWLSSEYVSPSRL